MFEAIVTLVLKEPGMDKLHEMPYTEVYRIEFDNEMAMREWLRGANLKDVPKCPLDFAKLVSRDEPR